MQSPGFWLVNLHIDAAGAVMAEYEGLQAGGSAGVYTQTFDAAGDRVGDERQVAAPPEQ